MRRDGLQCKNQTIHIVYSSTYCTVSIQVNRYHIAKNVQYLESKIISGKQKNMGITSAPVSNIFDKHWFSTRNFRPGLQSQFMYSLVTLSIY